MKKTTDLTTHCQIRDSHESNDEYNRDKNENGQTDSDFKYMKTHYIETGKSYL